MMRRLLILLLLLPPLTSAQTPGYANNGAGMPMSQSNTTDSITSYTAFLPNPTTSGNTLAIWVRYQIAGGALTCQSGNCPAIKNTCAVGTTCTVTLTSTASDSSIIVFANNLKSGTSLSSVTDSGGDTYTTPATSVNGSDAKAGAVDMKYVLSSASGVTSVTCNLSQSQTAPWTCGAYVYTTTASGFAYETSGNVDDSTASTTQTGTALTLSGSCDLLVRIGVFSTGVSSMNEGYNLNVDSHTNAEAYKFPINGTAPTYTLTSSGTIAEGALALKETGTCASSYERPTWSDNIGGNTYADADDCSDGLNNTVLGLWYVPNVAAGVTQIKATFAAATHFVQMQPYEFYNVGALDQASCNFGTGGSVTPGNFAATLAAPGDLILQVGAVDNTAAVTSWTAGSQADITWNLRSAMIADNYPSAVQWGVYNATATFSPTMTLAPTTPQWITGAMAFKSASAGSSQNSGLRVVYVQHDDTQNEAAASVSLQEPITGNTFAILFNSGCAGFSTTDCAYPTSSSDGTNTYNLLPASTIISNCAGAGGNTTMAFEYAKGVTAGTYAVTHTMHTRSSGGSGDTFMLFDILNGAPSPLDSTIGTSGVASAQVDQSPSGGTNTITPSYTVTPLQSSAEVILSQLGVAFNSMTGTASPSGAQFLSCNYSTETNPSHCDLNGGFAIFYPSSTNSETWTWKQDQSQHNGVGCGNGGSIGILGSAFVPDFTISVLPASQSVDAGNSTTYNVTVSPLNGFTGNVSLAASGLPSGDSGSFSPASVTGGSGTSTLTLNTAAGSSAGDSTVTITGTSGALTHSTTATLSVVAPDFSISVSPGSTSVAPGATATYTVSVSFLNGFTGAVSLAVSGLPSGASPTLAPSSITTSGNSTLTIITGSTVGSSTLSITGTSGTLMHSATAILNVTTAGSSTNVISIDFVGLGTAMGSSEQAGVLPKTNWNNATGARSSTPLALVDDAGTPTNVTVSWTSDDVWDEPIADQPGNVRMMKGYLDNGKRDTTTVTVNGLPADLNGFKIYVYADGSNGGSGSNTGIYQVSGPGITTSSVTLTYNSNFTGTFRRATASSAVGNYLILTIPNVSGFTLSAIPSTATNGYERAPVNGIQIVPQ